MNVGQIGLKLKAFEAMGDHGRTDFNTLFSKFLVLKIQKVDYQKLRVERSFHLNLYHKVDSILEQNSKLKNGSFGNPFPWLLSPSSALDWLLPTEIKTPQNSTSNIVFQPWSHTYHSIFLKVCVMLYTTLSLIKYFFSFRLNY